MAQVFDKVEVYHRARGGTLIVWSLHPLYQPAVGTVFTVLASRPGVDDWREVGQVIDQNALEDPQQWIWGKAPRLFYKVALRQPGGEEAESKVVQIGNELCDKDARLLREMVRKEELRLTKLAGTCGFLYKRRLWGATCPECTDYDTEEVTNAHCEACYGTGIVGGYFSPVEYWISDVGVNPTRRKAIDESRGVVGERVRYARGLNCPWLDKGDVWLNFRDDRRYFVQTVRELSFKGGIFVFDPIELRLAPVTDIIYTLPRPDDVDSSSSSSS